MGPELFCTDESDLKGARPTKQSDCYAFGMVIYEVLSGQVPFSSSYSCVVMRKVIDGERPGRPHGPEGAQFTDHLWQTLNWCWDAQPQCRPSVATVLERLEQDSRTPETPSQRSDERTDQGGRDIMSESFRIISRFNSRCFFALVCGILCLSQLQTIFKKVLPGQRGGTDVSTSQPTAFAQGHL
jgi:serine/threonine protein kinase